MNSREATLSLFVYLALTGAPGRSTIYGRVASETAHPHPQPSTHHLNSSECKSSVQTSAVEAAHSSQIRKAGGDALSFCFSVSKQMARGLIITKVALSDPDRAYLQAVLVRAGRGGRL